MPFQLPLNPRQSISCPTIMLQGSANTAAVASGAPTEVRPNASALAWFLPWDTAANPLVESVVVAAKRDGELECPLEAPSPK